jgi:hypothetical protein
MILKKGEGKKWNGRNFFKFYDINPQSKQHKTLENTTHTTFVNTSEKNARGKTSVQKCIL